MVKQCNNCTECHCLILFCYFITSHQHSHHFFFVVHCHGLFYVSSPYNAFLMCSCVMFPLVVIDFSLCSSMAQVSDLLVTFFLLCITLQLLVLIFYCVVFICCTLLWWSFVSSSPYVVIVCKCMVWCMHSMYVHPCSLPLL
jgi:hypothetical protein